MTYGVKIIPIQYYKQSYVLQICIFQVRISENLDFSPKTHFFGQSGLEPVLFSSMGCI